MDILNATTCLVVWRGCMGLYSIGSIAFREPQSSLSLTTAFQRVGHLLVHLTRTNRRQQKNSSPDHFFFFEKDDTTFDSKIQSFLVDL